MTCAALIIAPSIAFAQAGAAAGAVERNIAKRLATRGGAVALTAAERAALQKLWLQADRDALKRIEVQFGAYLDKNRLAQAGKTPAIIAERDAFDQALRRAEPKMSEEKRKAILGYYFDEKLYVNGHHPEMLTTLAHERIHQLSHPRFQQALGSEVNEGFTESFARRVHPVIPVRDAPKVYTAEQRISQMLHARVPEKDLANAYFGGDISRLRRYVDADLGGGTFDNFAAAARRGDLARAEAILQSATRPR